MYGPSVFRSPWKERKVFVSLRRAITFVCRSFVSGSKNSQYKEFFMLNPLVRHMVSKIFSPRSLLRTKYRAFKDVLRCDAIGLELIADLEEICYLEQYADWARIAWLCERLGVSTQRMICGLQKMNPALSRGLLERHTEILEAIRAELVFPVPSISPPYVLLLDDHATDPTLAGGKGATLARIAGVPDIPTLPGFVITANAFHLFLEHNGLREKLDRCLRSIRPCKTRKMQELAAIMQEEIMAGEIPPAVVLPILEAVASLAETGSSPQLILRSSAVAEDSAVSFAGQYLSVAGVTTPDILHAYKKILAGKYSAKAMFYRIFHGLSDVETPMAVVVQPMLRPRVSGVTYTRDPGQARHCMGIYAVFGSGESLMDGATSAGVTFFDRNKDDFIERVQDVALLDLDQCRALVRLCLRLEEIQGCPQDVEWGLNEDGSFVILQTRPIGGQVEVTDPVSPGSTQPPPPLPVSVCRAAAGIATGPVYILQNWDDLDMVPEQCILLVPGLSPELVQIIPKVRGVLAKTGSRACHFASVARECGVPVLIGPEMDAVLRPSMVVTMDADTALLYEGEVEPLLQKPKSGKGRHSLFGEKRLARIMSPVTRLTMTDPDASDFVAPNCQSMHDIIRFVHEQAVEDMFDLVNKNGRGLFRARKLVSDLPLSMYVLDLQNGLSSTARGREITPDDVVCVPFKSLWEGLCSPDILWDDRMPHMDWEAFDRISAGIFSKDTALLSSYAVITKRYTHLMLRFGYHFSVVDCLCGDEPQNNYIHFRFKGGGAAYDGRVLRLEFITRILSARGFQVVSKGDLLDARMARCNAADIRAGLIVLGRILAMTRLMDIRLETTEQIDVLVEEFYQA